MIYHEHRENWGFLLFFMLDWHIHSAEDVCVFLKDPQQVDRFLSFEVCKRHSQVALGIPGTGPGGGGVTHGSMNMFSTLS